MVNFPKCIKKMVTTVTKLQTEKIAFLKLSVTFCNHNFNKSYKYISLILWLLLLIVTM